MSQSYKKEKHVPECPQPFCLIGPQGFIGKVGYQGQTVHGPSGYRGYQGAQGSQHHGIQGYFGYQGNMGSFGLWGNQGPDGVGAQGLQGCQGMPGFQGPLGYQGYQGILGCQGLVGYQGNEGYQGPQGKSFIQGPQGFYDGIYYYYVDNETPPVTGTFQYLLYRLGDLLVFQASSFSALKQTVTSGSYFYIPSINPSLLLFPTTTHHVAVTLNSDLVELYPLTSSTTDLGITSFFLPDTTYPSASISIKDFELRLIYQF